jgi:Zn-dependent protease with chaperone function
VVVAGCVIAFATRGLFVALILIATGPVAIWSLRRRRSVSGPLIALACIFFFVVGAQQIGPFYLQGTSPVAKLSRIAATDPANRGQMLIVYHGVYEPASLFYSRLRVYEADTSAQLAAFTRDHRTKRIIFKSADLQYIARVYHIRVLAIDDAHVYASIRREKDR